jgi:hypothetical protein
MKNKNLKRIFAGITIFIFAITVGNVSYGDGRVTKTYDIGGATVKVKIISSLMPTMLEGRIKEESGFYFFKMNFMNNFFSVNVPQRSYDKMTEQQKNDLVAAVLLLHGRSFEVSRAMLGYMPTGYRFNVTFGETQSGYPFNRVYSYSKTSNIYPDFLPFEGKMIPGEAIKTPMTGFEESIMLHEIGHSIFAIVIGNIKNPKNKYMEEGFVDYFADKVLGRKSPHREAIEKITITNAQAANINGLSQLDVDVSIWGEEKALNSSTMEGYAGITHHHFGYEFIRTYIDVFGEKNLRGFLDRFRQTEERPDEGDYGTKRINDLLLKMGYPLEKTEEFQKMLHERLKKNIFNLTS